MEEAGRTLIADGHKTQRPFPVGRSEHKLLIVPRVKAAKHKNISAQKTWPWRRATASRAELAPYRIAGVEPSLNHPVHGVTNFQASNFFHWIIDPKKWGRLVNWPLRGITQAVAERSKNSPLGTRRNLSACNRIPGFHPQVIFFFFFYF